MARPRKKKSENLLSPEAKRTLYAIVLFLAAIFLFLGSLGLAGIAGKTVHKGLLFLFGYGFIFVPISFIAWGSYLFNFIEAVDKKILLGSIFLVVASEGLLSVISEEAGGLLGTLIQNPLIKLLDIYVGVSLLIALLAASIVLIFNIPLSLSAFKERVHQSLSRRK